LDAKGVFRICTKRTRPRWDLGRENTTRKKAVNKIKHINDVKPDYTKALDVRGEPTMVCPCGCYVWNLKVSFDEEGVITTYFTDMECIECGTLATAPMPGVNIGLEN
jgi:ferredoxin-like protein FixX